MREPGPWGLLPSAGVCEGEERGWAWDRWLRRKKGRKVFN